MRTERRRPAAEEPGEMRSVHISGFVAGEKASYMIACGLGSGPRRCPRAIPEVADMHLPRHRLLTVAEHRTACFQQPGDPRLSRTEVAEPLALFEAKPQRGQRTVETHHTQWTGQIPRRPQHSHDVPRRAQADIPRTNSPACRERSRRRSCRTQRFRLRHRADHRWNAPPAPRVHAPDAVGQLHEA
jgi:hypothetical protein